MILFWGKGQKMSDRDVLLFNGERYLPEVGGNIELEHYHRYIIATHITKGKRVLDIASGEGYGSEIISKTAKNVIGVDISFEAVSHAQNKYKKNNLNFVVGSCTSIPFEDSFFDVVVSFETLEHLDAQDSMLKEIKRVLCTNGVLIISTPDKDEYSNKGDYTNIFHKKELSKDDFLILIGKYFLNTNLYGQKIIFGSAIFGVNNNENLKFYNLTGHQVSAHYNMLNPKYLIAIASDVELLTFESGILETSVNESEVVLNFSRLLAERDVVIDNLNISLSKQQDNWGSVVSCFMRIVNLVLQKIVSLHK